jgi:hypothetical protein
MRRNEPRQWRWRLPVCAAVCFLFLCDFGRAASNHSSVEGPASTDSFLKPYEADGLRFDAGFRPDQSEYVWGEPIHYFTYVVHNRGDQPLAFVEGGDYRGGRSESNKITAVDANGTPVPVPPMGNFGGRIQVVTLKPGESYTKSLPVDRRLTFGGPGVYQVTGRRTLKLTASLDQQPQLEVPTENSFSLTIHPYSPQRMAQAIATLAVRIYSYGLEVPKPIEETEPVGLTPGNRLCLDLETLVAIQDPQALDVLIGLANSPGVLRPAAIKCLGRRTEPRALTTVVQALASPDATLQAAAAEALGALKTPEAVDLLMGHLARAEPSVAAALLQAMGRTREPKVLPLLTRALATGETPRRRAAVEGLVAFGSGEAVEVLKTCVADPDLDFREFVIGQLAESLQQPIDAQWLVPVIQGRKDTHTIGDAPRLMRLYTGERAVPALLSCLDFENPSIRSYYNWTLIYNQGWCQGGLRIPWISDLNRDGTAEELQANRKTLKTLRTWVDHYYAHRMDEEQIPQSQYWQEMDKLWGAPVDGIRIRARCDQRVWPEGTPQVIQIDLCQSPEGGSINLTKAPDVLEVEINGQWYACRPPVTQPTLGIDEGHGKSFHNLVLDDRWQRLTDHQPLELTPGRYTLRVRLSTLPPDRRTGLALSQTVSFEIIAAD